MRCIFGGRGSAPPLLWAVLFYAAKQSFTNDVTIPGGAGALDHCPADVRIACGGSPLNNHLANEQVGDILYLVSHVYANEATAFAVASFCVMD